MLSPIYCVHRLTYISTTTLQGALRLALCQEPTCTHVAASCASQNQEPWTTQTALPLVPSGPLKPQKNAKRMKVRMLLDGRKDVTCGFT